MLCDWNSWRRKQSLELFCSPLSIISALTYAEIKNKLLLRWIWHNLSALILTTWTTRTHRHNSAIQTTQVKSNHAVKRMHKYNLSLQGYNTNISRTPPTIQLPIHWIMWVIHGTCLLTYITALHTEQVPSIVHECYIPKILITVSQIKHGQRNYMLLYLK